MSARYPLLRVRDLGRPLAFYRDRVVTAGEFLQAAQRLAARLPERSYVINDCADRYHFLVGLAAALLRAQVSLFPSNRTPHVWEQLRAQYPSLYCLTDQTEVPAVPVEVHRWDEGRAPHEASSDIPSFPEDQRVGIAFTSGSTGAPKPFPKYWGAVVREARAGAQALGLAPPAGAAIVATVPPQHMYGFVASVMIPLQTGAAVYAQLPFFPEDVRTALEACPTATARLLVTTPAQLRALVLDKTRLPPLELILSSAAPLPAAVAAEAERLFGTRVLEYYGSTETGAIASRQRTQTELWRTFEGVRVAALERGFRVEADYFREPVLLSDLIEVVSPHEFRLLGRDTDLVKIGGKRASLMHLNQQLQEIEGVVDGTFLLLDSDDGREPRLTAFVVAPGRTREEILSGLRARIDEVFLPRPLRLVERLPRTATGKLPRAALLELLKGQEAQELSDAGGS